MSGLRSKNIHVPLPPKLHEGLKEQAVRLGTPATVLARTAIEEWVERTRREQLDEEVRQYALAMGGTEADLDVLFEEAGVEAWPAAEE